MLTDRMGIDLGTVTESTGVAKAVAELGVRHVRVGFPLAGRARADESYLAAAHDAASELVQGNARVLAVVDGNMTVAPGGLGTFDDPPVDERLAAAWSDELVGNVSRLAERLGDLVHAWEVFPEPNAGQEPRMAPARWIALVEAAARALRTASPHATIVAGGLLSEEDDDGVDYLRAALESRNGADSATGFNEPPFDSIGVRLRVLADGGASEDAVGAALSERVQRVWRVLENHEGTEAATERGIFVTGVGWDANRCGEDVQGRNAWTAFDTLTSEPVVRAVFWSTLHDRGSDRSGLYRDESLSEVSQRPAWKAVYDFSEYARMITPVASAADLLGVPDEDEPTTVVEGSDLQGAEPATTEPGTGVEAGRAYVFRIPGAAEILRGQGIEGDELAAVLAAVTRKYGGNQWLPPGEYDVQLAEEAITSHAPSPHTNQHMISAMYRAGGGTWELLERSGLSLSDLAASRHEPYDGPPASDMVGLDDDERSRVRQELAAIV